MTNDELRALADALSRQRQADEHGIYCAVPRQAVDAAIKYLRAQADAQPVAWLYYSKHASQPFTTTCPPNTWGPNADDDRKTAVALYTHPAPAVPAGYKLVPVEPTPEMLSAVGMMDGYDWHAPGCSPDADHANWYSAMIAAAPAAPQAEPIDPHMIVADDRFPDEQAEPKREPMTALRILEIEDNASRQWRDNGRIIEYAVVFARMIERAHGIGGSDER